MSSSESRQTKIENAGSVCCAALIISLLWNPIGRDPSKHNCDWQIRSRDFDKMKIGKKK